MDQYTFSSKAKMLTFVLMGIGLVALIGGLVMTFTAEEGHWDNRFWSNMLINGFFFFSISLAAVFFIAVQYAAEAAWAVVLKRVMEAVGSFIAVGAGILIVVWLVGYMGGHHVYHWLEDGIDDPSAENYDALVAGKMPFFNMFWPLTIIFLGVYIGYYMVMRKRSLQEDSEGGTGFFFKNQRMSAIFLVFFGFSSMAASWLWLMSIDVHWFSTIFGWYIFAGFWLSGMTMMTLITLHLKRKGHLPQVTENHIHDMGKWMFAISFLWTYLWFSQFMLIWYADIPEEVTPYIARFRDYNPLFMIMVLVNFTLPMLLLMARDAKRNTTFLTIIGVIIFVFHWIDVFIVVTPGVMHENWHLSWFEVGLALGFLGLFLFIVLRSLSKAPLMVKNHPYLDESIHHEQ